MLTKMLNNFFAAVKKAENHLLGNCLHDFLPATVECTTTYMVRKSCYFNDLGDIT